MLIGIARNRIAQWINSLSIERANAPEETIKKDGTNKQCSAHAIDNPAANLSLFGWGFMISILYFTSFRIYSNAILIW